MCDTQTVHLYHWKAGYSDEVGELYAYIELRLDGVRKYVELRRKEVESVQTS